MDHNIQAMERAERRAQIITGKGDIDELLIIEYAEPYTYYVAAGQVCAIVKQGNIPARPWMPKLGAMCVNWRGCKRERVPGFRYPYRNPSPISYL